MSGFNERSLISVLQEAVDEENGGIAGLERAAKMLAGGPRDVATLLSWCMSAPDHWRQIADRAYYHPNGFTKFVLYDEPDCLFRLRLHVWTGESGRNARGEQNVHGHRWDFASTVIAGRGLCIDEYVLSDAAEAPCDAHGAPYRAYEYRPHGGHDVTGAERAVEGDLVAVGEVHLQHAVRFSPATGGTYACTTDKLHTVVPVGDDLTATLIVQGPNLTDGAPVFRRADQPVQASPVPLTVAEARHVMDATIVEVRRSWRLASGY